MNIGKMTISFTKSDRFPDVRWNLFDVVVVWLLSVMLFAVLATGILFVIPEDKVAIKVFKYAGFTVGFFLPLLWIRLKYGLTKKNLGLRKGSFSYPIIIISGFLCAILFSTFYRVSPFWRSIFGDIASESNLLIDVILLPFSVSGFATLVLTPFWEETLFRGFIYGYLRKKIGLIPGLFLQSIIFSISHADIIQGDYFYLIIYRIVVGVIFGLLYELFGTIYSSVICHGIITYTIVLFSLYWK